MWCLVFNNDRYSVSKNIGFTPDGLVGCLPDAALMLQYPFILEDNGSFKICPIKLSTWMKEQIKNGN